MVDREAWNAVVHGVGKELDMTEWLNWTELNWKFPTSLRKNLVSQREGVAPKYRKWVDAGVHWASALQIIHGHSSQGAKPPGIPDGRTENSYSDKAAWVQLPARESEAFWTFWLLAGPRSLFVCPNSISYTPVNADRAGSWSFISLFASLSSLSPSWMAFLNLGYMMKCAKQFSSDYYYV